MNRDPDRPVDVNVLVADRTCAIQSVDVLHGPPKAQNTWDEPDQVAPAPGKARLDDAGNVVVHLPAPCHAVVHLTARAR